MSSLLLLFQHGLGAWGGRAGEPGGGWAGLLLAHAVRLCSRLSPWRSGGAAPAAVKVGLPMSAPHPRIVVLATGSIASVKVPALAVGLSKLAGSAAQVKIVTSTAGICARTHTRTSFMDVLSVHTYGRHACMHADTCMCP